MLRIRMVKNGVLLVLAFVLIQSIIQEVIPSSSHGLGVQRLWPGQAAPTQHVTTPGVGEESNKSGFDRYILGNGDNVVGKTEGREKARGFWDVVLRRRPVEKPVHKTPANHTVTYCRPVFRIQECSYTISINGSGVTGLVGTIYVNDKLITLRRTRWLLVARFSAPPLCSVQLVEVYPLADARMLTYQLEQAGVEEVVVGVGYDWQQQGDDPVWQLLGQVLGMQRKEAINSFGATRLTKLLGFVSVGGFPGLSTWSMTSSRGNRLKPLWHRGKILSGPRFNISEAPLSLPQLIDRYPDVNNGHWRPRDCAPRWRLAIIIHYRNRPHHLRVFMNNLHRFLQTQQVEYTFYVIDQAGPELFNRATLMNVGFLEAQKRHQYDCFVFHDVDLIPEVMSNLYKCDSQPRHLAIRRSQQDYAAEPDGEEFFGGAVVMTADHVTKINGFPNRMYGWGGEDDDIWKRVQLQHLSILRYPALLGRYYSLGHRRDESNPRSLRTREDVQNMTAPTYQEDGLNSVQYSVLYTHNKRLFVHVTVRIPGPRSESENEAYQKLHPRQQLKTLRDWNKHVVQEVKSGLTL